MKEYVERDELLSYAAQIRPSSYFNLSPAQRLVLDKQREIAEELENLPCVRLSDAPNPSPTLELLASNPPVVYIEVLDNPEESAFGVLVNSSYYEMSDGTAMPSFSEQIQSEKENLLEFIDKKIRVWVLPTIHNKED